MEPLDSHLDVNSADFKQNHDRIRGLVEELEHRLAAAWVCNGSPGDVRHQKRQRAINGAIYEDLEIVADTRSIENPPPADRASDSR